MRVIFAYRAVVGSGSVGGGLASGEPDAVEFALAALLVTLTEFTPEKSLLAESPMMTTEVSTGAGIDCGMGR
jgi:hypothetical protein